jgi:hypothetical protein
MGNQSPRAADQWEISAPGPGSLSWISCIIVYAIMHVCVALCDVPGAVVLYL